MRKIIVDDLLIDSKLRKILSKDKNIEITKDKVYLNAFGKDLILEKEWLFNIDEHRIAMPKGFEERILDLEFYKHKVKGPYDKVTVLFKKPVEVMTDYRMIPRFPNYAISEDGSILNIKKNHIRDISNIITHATQGTYLTFYAYNRRLNYSSKVYIHISVASAWIENPDPENYIIVDHKNEDKWDCHKDNLRWATPSQNTQYSWDNRKR